jgi:predicted nucleic acid-binding Zn ribbon protein
MVKKIKGQGRWHVQRERCRLSNPSPAPAFREPAKLADVLPGILQQFGLGHTDWVARLKNEWDAIVGGANAAHCTPGRLDNGCLTIFVDSAVWRYELERQAGGRLLRNIQGRVGADVVRKVLLRLDPDATR